MNISRSFYVVMAGVVVAAGVTGCGGASNSSATAGSGSGGSGSGSGGSSVNTGAAQYVYVVQQPASGSGSILQFSATASGSATPTATITPGLTLNSVATDQVGNIYVATATDVREYASGATGSATPTRSITIGTASGIYAIDGMAVSPTGEIVLGQDGGDVDEWSATQTGAVAPQRRIPGFSQTGGGLSPVVVANQVAVDASDNLYVGPQGNSGVAAVVVFGPTANGNAAPARAVGGVGVVRGLTVDSAGNIYTTSETSCAYANMVGVCSGMISEYAAGSTATTAPMRTISGSATTLGMLCGIQVDAVGNIYVISYSNSAMGNATVNPNVLKFAATASGNVAPVSSFTSTQWTSAALNGFNPSLAIH